MDGISWATKSIIGEHKLCVRLEENPIVSYIWLITHLGDVIGEKLDIRVHSL